MPKVIKGGNSKFDSVRKKEVVEKTIEKKKSSGDQFSFGKKLAAVDKTTRDRGVKNLSQWMVKREEMSQVDFLKVWKALYYCYWLSDKPIVQYELADQLTNLVLNFNDNEKPILFIQTFYATLKREWAGIDYLRIDKYLKFIRQMLNKSLRFLQSREWDLDLISQYNQILPISADAENIGLQLHLISIYLDEINLVGGNDLDSSIVSKLLDPFLPALQTTNHDVLRKGLNSLYDSLLSYWRKGRERTEYDEEEELKYLNINHEELLADLTQICFAKETPSKNRKMCYALKDRVEKAIEEEKTRKQKEEEITKPKKKTNATKRKAAEVVEEKPKETKAKKVVKKKKEPTAPAEKLLQELEHQVIPLDEIEKKHEAEEHPKTNGTNKAKAKETPKVTPAKKKSLVWNLEQNKAQEFEDSSNIHPVSPAIRNKNAKPHSILRAEPSPMKPNIEIKVPEPVPKRPVRKAAAKRK